MKVNGIELFKMIKAGEINDDTKIKVIYGTYNPIYIYRDECLYSEEGKEVGISIIFSEQYFEILENKTGEIEEYRTEYTERCIDMEVRKKLNEVIRVVNKLNKLHEPPIIDTSKETHCMTD